VAEAVRDSIVINADADTILDVVSDLESYPQWQPEVRSVEVLATDDDGWPTKVRLDVDAKVAQANMLLEYSYPEEGMRWRLLEGTGLSRNDGAYLLADRGDGTTEVTYEVTIDTSVPVPSVLRRQMARRLADSALKRLKTRVEAGA
jgi:uncharacterized membrane protein